MIMQLFLLLGQQATTPDQVLERYAQAHQTPPKFEARLTSAVNGSGTYDCLLLMDGLERSLFRMSFKGHSYSISITPETLLEMDSERMIYDRYPSQGISIGASRISDGASYFPHWVSVQDFRKSLPSSKWELKGRETINGFGTDKIHIHTENQGKGLDLTLAISDAGYVVRADELEWDPVNRISRTWIVKTLKLRSSISHQEIEPRIPIGYTPFALDYTPGGLELGEKFPMTGWTRPSGSVSISELVGGRATLVAVLGEDCEASQRALPWLRKLSSKVPVVLVSDGKKATLAPEALTDPAGKNLKQLDIQGTPYMAWIDSKGVIQKLWMGFDAENPAPLEREILDAAKGVSEEAGRG